MQEKNFFSYSGVKICRGKLWYVTEEENFLMSIDIQSGVVDSTGIIPGAEGIYLAYRGLVVYNNILFLIPFNAFSIMVYDALNQVYKDIVLPPRILEIVGDEPKFFEGNIIGDKLIMYGFTHYILIYDIGNAFFDIVDVKDAVVRVADIDKWYLRFGLVFEEKVYINLLYSNLYVVFDLNNKKVEVNAVGDKFTRKRYSMLLKQGNFIYYVSESIQGTFSIVKFTPKDFDILDGMEWDDIESCGEDLPRFLWGTVLDDELLLFPGHLSKFVRVNLETYKLHMEHVEDPKTNWNWYNCWTSLYGDIVNDDCAISIMPGRKCLIIAKKDSIEYKEVTIGESVKKCIRKCYIDSFTSGKIVNEKNNIFTLSDFIECIV